MISEIKLENFKCFEEIIMPLKNVTVLTGINGMGKSTIIQSLLLLRQSYFKDKEIRGLYLSGKYVDLGNAQDILYEKASCEALSIAYKTIEGNQAGYFFRYKPESNFLPVIPLQTSIEVGYKSSIFGNRFSYLSAYRIKPQDLYTIANEEEIVNREFGNNGEFALQYLGLYGDDVVINSNVVIPDKLGNSLKNQVRVWLDRISPGVSPQVLLNLNLRTAEIRYEFIEGKNKTNSYRSTNVGFGITYVLPVIVALLSAKAGDLIILENPEAHIHPAGQRMLGELIALAGAGGVQVLVETHSDHVLNGIRVAVKQEKIKKEDVQLAFFYKDNEDDYKHKFVAPRIQSDGRLDMWPEGFFDEWDKALYDLI